MRKVARFAIMILTATIATTTPAADTAPTPVELAAQAEVLGECFVNKTTGEDRIMVARWMLAALSSAPQMAEAVKVDPARKMELDKGMAAIFTRLMAVDCSTEARLILKAKSSVGFETAGGSLGRIAMKELLSNPVAEQALAEYTKYLNESDFAHLSK